VKAQAPIRTAERASSHINPQAPGRHVLVSLVGRRTPIEAINFGRTLAATIGATLHGLFVWPSPILPSEVPRLLEIDPDALTGMVLDVQVGDLAASIAASTRSQAVSFLVLCAESEGPDACSVGAVAARALQQAGTSVIVVRPGYAPRRLARILVPLDGTPSMAAALAPAGELARLSGAALDIVMVGEIERPSLPRAVEIGAMLAPQYIDQPQHEWPAFSQEFIERFMGAVGHCPRGVPTRFFLRVGDPGREILRAATDLDADLIALAWHGGCEGGHGVVFRRVLSDAGLPVLVLRC
jgi:nucleotide-binding universal stress UspA family protein